MRWTVVALVVSIAAGALFGRHVPAESQRALFDLLLNTAGIVFGVSGAWIAIVHSTEMKSERPQTGRFENLTGAMTTSAATIVLVLAQRFTHTVLVAAGLSKSWIPWCCAVSFAAWTFLAFLQARSLFAGVPSAHFARIELFFRRKHKGIVQSLPPKKTRTPDAAKPPAR